MPPRFAQPETIARLFRNTDECLRRIQDVLSALAEQQASAQTQIAQSLELLVASRAALQVPVHRVAPELDTAHVSPATSGS